MILTQTAYADCLQGAEAAIAMAGTATEQFVGLGKPAFTTPGAGPQFTPTFAQLQTRLLGPSVILVDTAEAMGGSDGSRIERSRSPRPPSPNWTAPPGATRSRRRDRPNLGPATLNSLGRVIS